MNIYRDDRAFDLYIQAALEDDVEDPDMLDELERLRAENEELAVGRSHYAGECDRLVAENNKMREALAWAVQELRRCSNGDYVLHIADTLSVHLP